MVIGIIVRLVIGSITILQRTEAVVPRRTLSWLDLDSQSDAAELDVTRPRRLMHIISWVPSAFSRESSVLSFTNFWYVRTFSTGVVQLEATPAQLVYGRDILLPVRFQADWAQIRARRQVVINRNNKRENNKRIAHDYKVGDLVLLETPGILP